MPELPEIETLKLSLEKRLLNKTISGIDIRRVNLRYNLPIILEKSIVSTKIAKLHRRAKYLILDLSNNNSLVIHLGMSGRFTISPSNIDIKKHDHVIFHIDGKEVLIFNDARRFGMIYVLPTNNLMKEKLFNNLGPEPLSHEFNELYLQEKLLNKKIPIKNAIMDNHIVVGVGNIYASESLFLANINPLRQSNSLSKNEISNLVKSIKIVLENAINSGGTTLKDFVNGDNKPGFFKQKLLIYGKDGRECNNCNNIILKIKQAGRTSFYCLNCQS